MRQTPTYLLEVGSTRSPSFETLAAASLLLRLPADVLLFKDPPSRCDKADPKDAKEDSAGCALVREAAAQLKPAAGVASPAAASDGGS